MTDDYLAPRDAHGRFLPGSPGRPKGALNKLSSRVAHAIIRNFEANSDDILDYLRVHHVAVYAQLVTRLVAKATYVEDETLEPLETDPAAQSLTIARRALKARKTRPHFAQCEYEAMQASAAPGGPSFYGALADRIEREMERRPAAASAPAVAKLEQAIADIARSHGAPLPREREAVSESEALAEPSLRTRLRAGASLDTFIAGRRAAQNKVEIASAAGRDC